MTTFRFNSAISIRAYGDIVVEAESIEAAKAAIAADGFKMREAFEPHGSGEDDFDYGTAEPNIWLNHVIDDDGNETDLDEALPTPYELKAREISVFVVSTCIPERGEAPCIPSVFTTEPEAVAYLEQMLADEWANHGPFSEDTGNRLPYPGNWQEAQEAILAEFYDGSWGQWALTGHQIIGKSVAVETESSIPLFDGEQVDAALSVWEAMFEMREKIPELDRAWNNYGTSAMRQEAAKLSKAAQAAWLALSDDDRDGICAPFDWEFVPAFLMQATFHERGCASIDGTPAEIAESIRNKLASHRRERS